MNKLFESAGIALAAIWGSKLRSLMTVFGNIGRPLAAIIAVVSPDPGAERLGQIGDSQIRPVADSFAFSSFPVTLTTTISTPFATTPACDNDARAIRRFSPLVSAVMLDSRGSAQWSTATRPSTASACRCDVGVHEFLDLRRRAAVG